MMRFCPICGSESELQKTKKMEEVTIRGEVFEVEVEGFSCENCKEVFFDLESDDMFAIALQEYRRKHSYLGPEDIKSLRRKFGLTQQELSSLLGWGGATLSRYENGTLQTEGHERVLRLIMHDPSVLLDYINQAPAALSSDKRERITSLIKDQIEDSYPIEKFYEERFGNYRSDEYSGFRSLNMRKVYNLILFFCKEGQFITKLNKLIFYTDFSYYKDQSKSVTGLRYIHLQYGPVPDKYNYYLANMEELGLIRLEEVNFGEYGGQVCRSVKDPDLSCFTTSEVNRIKEVWSVFSKVNCSDISELSHDESAWKETSDTEKINYDYARQLKHL